MALAKESEDDRQTVKKHRGASAVEFSAEDWLKACLPLQSFDASLPEGFLGGGKDESGNLEASDSELRFPNDYFASYKYAPQASYRVKNCWTGRQLLPPPEMHKCFRKGHAGSSSGSPKDWSGKKLKLPKGFMQEFQALYSDPCFIEAAGMFLGEKILEEDRLLKIITSELGLLEELGTQDSASLNTAIDNVFDFNTYWRFLSNYNSMDLSLLNMLTSDKIRRITSLHISRHFLRYILSPVSCNGGWTRPRVLILTPTRFTAKVWAENISRLLCRPHRKGYDQFVCDYSILERDGSIGFARDFGNAMLKSPSGKRKQLDHIERFRGNPDDNFVVGITITKECVQFDVPLFSADLVIGSPLGLRCKIEEQNEENIQGESLLSSLEILVVDSYDFLEEQNTEHLTKIVAVCNEHPQRLNHGVIDISKLRPCFFEEHGQNRSIYYRQTIALGSRRCLVTSALMSKYDCNFRGVVKLGRLSQGCLGEEITRRLGRQLLSYKVGGVSDEFTEAHDNLISHFEEHFVKTFHPRIAQDPVLIVVPTWLEYIEIRRCLKRGLTTDNITSLHERTKEKMLVKKRRMISEGLCPVVITTERFLFYRRLVLSGIKHIICVGCPRWGSILLDLVGQSIIVGIYWSPTTHWHEMENTIGYEKLNELMIIKSKNGFNEL